MFAPLLFFSRKWGKKHETFVAFKGLFAVF